MSQNNYLIYIIDDNPMNLMLTSKILENFGYDTAIANSGETGLLLLEQKVPSLILLDISMPEMDGYEVCKRIKQNEQWQNIPIIFLTANNQTEDLVEGFNVGGVDYITKPFKSEELFVRVSAHLEIAESRRTIMEMNKSRDRLYSIIAHDIRSPLSGILQTIDAIDQGYFDPTSPDFKDIIKHLRERTKETSTLLTSLLQWTRMQDEKVQLIPSNTNVSTILKSCYELLQANAKEKLIDLKLDVADNLYAYCDEVSMHTVIRNLMSNAIKFTHSGGVIELKGFENENFVTIVISDNGVGMTEETIDKIFNQNEHYTSSGTKNEQGTGLGLMLVKDFLRKNNAAFDVKSKINEGTAFIINLSKVLN